MHLKTLQEWIHKLHCASRGFQGITKFKNPCHRIFWVITRTWTFIPTGRGNHWRGKWRCYLRWHMFTEGPPQGRSLPLLPGKANSPSGRLRRGKGPSGWRRGGALRRKGGLWDPPQGDSKGDKPRACWQRGGQLWIQAGWAELGWGEPWGTLGWFSFKKVSGVWSRRLPREGFKWRILRGAEQILGGETQDDMPGLIPTTHSGRGPIKHWELFGVGAAASWPPPAASRVSFWPLFTRTPCVLRRAGDLSPVLLGTLIGSS